MEQATTSGTSDSKAEVDLLFDIDHSLELTKNLFKIEENEQKEFLTFKISMKQKEEMKLRERMEQFNKEKVVLANEMRRQSEELNSSLCGKKSKDKFKILNGQYLVLSLLGRGGYSEVYKAYDLEN
jgi:tousled-like kinase